VLYVVFGFVALVIGSIVGRLLLFVMERVIQLPAAQHAGFDEERCPCDEGGTVDERCRAAEMSIRERT
jgi:hypothetical protein